MPDMTSKQRILATVRRQPVDHLPLCFEGLCHGVTRFVYDQFPSRRKRCAFYLDRGIDVALSHSPPSINGDGFTTKAWTQTATNDQEPLPLVGQQYITPDGTLQQVIRYTSDYDNSVYGATATKAVVRLFADHNVPASRSKEYLVSRREHLPALRHILRPLDGKQRQDYLHEMRLARQFCEANGILLAAYLSGIGDPIIWMSGVELPLIAALDDPDFMAEYVAIVAQWNLASLQLMIDGGVEYVVRRGWYETADFWSPTLYRRLLLPPLQAETNLARQAGIIYAYCMNSGINPLLDCLAESGIDILCNLDPATPQIDMALIKSRLGHAITLCGGVNNHHVLEHGSPEDVRRAVNQAVTLLAPGGAFILAPGDSILDTGPTARQNFDVMVKAWRSSAAIA